MPTLVQVIECYLESTPVSFYDYLVLWSKTSGKVTFGVEETVEFLLDKPVDVLNNICNGSIDYYNKFDMYIQFASCVLEACHDQINPEILRKYYNLSHGLNFDNFPELKKVVKKWKDIKTTNSIILNGSTNLGIPLETYLQILEAQFGIKLNENIFCADFDKLNDVDWNYIVKREYKTAQKDVLEYLNNNVSRIQDWDWIETIIADKTDDIKYYKLVMAYNNRFVKSLRKRTMELEQEVIQLKSNDPINRLKLVKIVE